MAGPRGAIEAGTRLGHGKLQPVRFFVRICQFPGQIIQCLDSQGGLPDFVELGGSEMHVANGNGFNGANFQLVRLDFR